MFHTYTIPLHLISHRLILHYLTLRYPLLHGHPPTHHLRTVRSHGLTAQEECKIVTYRSRHLDIGPRDVLSYMLALASSSVPLSSSVSSAEG